MNRADGTRPNHIVSAGRQPPSLGYCFSYTATLLIFWPCGLVPVVVTVRVLPSAATTFFWLVVTLPPFLLTLSSVCASIRFTVTVSEFGLLPVIGDSLPSRFEV